MLVTGTSRRQLHAISEEIDHVLEKEFGDRRLGIEGYAESRWILLDFGDIVVHMFDEETRGYYDLEQLWAGAKRVPFESAQTRIAPGSERSWLEAVTAFGGRVSSGDVVTGVGSPCLGLRVAWPNCTLAFGSRRSGWPSRSRLLISRSLCATALV